MGLLNKKPSKLSKYQDPTGEFDNTQLKQAAWFAAHRLQLRKALIVFLSVWCGLTVGISLILWMKYFAYDVWQDNDRLAAQTAEFQNFTLTQSQYRARPLDIGGTRVYQSNTNKYDFVTPVSNPNERFLVRVNYHFEFGGTSTTAQTMVLLPGQRVPATALGVNTERGFPSQVRFVIDDRIWKRVSAHAIPEIEEFMSERRNFVVSDIAYEPDNEAEGRFANQVSFIITNESVYNYWDVPLYIELLRGSETVGILFTSLAQFRAGEIREVDLRYVGDLPFVDSLRVSPVLNIFDPNAYMDVSL